MREGSTEETASGLEVKELGVGLPMDCILVKIATQVCHRKVQGMFRRQGPSDLNRSGCLYMRRLQED